MHRIIAVTPEPDVTDEMVAARLATPQDRAREMRGLLWGDHGFLRARFQNRHLVGPGMWRSNQPSPAHLEAWAAEGIKTVINLRGVSAASFHVLERDACKRLGLELVTFRVNSREPPRAPIPRLARELFDTIAYPALLHCKSGADRAGVMSVFYRHFRMNETIPQAVEQLSGKYLHVKTGKTGILDDYFARYITEGEANGLDLITWAETVHDWDAHRLSFRPSPIGSFFIDQILRRE